MGVCSIPEMSKGVLDRREVGCTDHDGSSIYIRSGRVYHVKSGEKTTYQERISLLRYHIYRETH